MKYELTLEDGEGGHYKTTSACTLHGGDGCVFLLSEETLKTKGKEDNQVENPVT